MTADNVQALHQLTEEQALASLATATGRVSATRMAAQWGWPRGRVRRRLAAWAKAGRIAATEPAAEGIDSTEPLAAGRVIDTAEMAGLAGRLEAGRASPEDLRVAGRLVMALVHRLPADGSLIIDEP